MGHYRESEWDSQLVRGFFHPSDEVLVSTNNVRCEGWEIKLPQDPRVFETSFFILICIEPLTLSFS